MRRIKNAPRFASLCSVGVLSTLSLALTVAGCSGEDATGAEGTGGFGGFPPGYGGQLVGSGGVVGVGGGQVGTGGTPVPPGDCPAAIFQECKACHDGQGTAATPEGMSFQFWEDFHAPSPKNPAAPVYQGIPARLRATTPSPMPPTGQLPADKLGVIDRWVAAGAPYCDGFARRTPLGTGGAGNGGAGNGGAGPIGGAGGLGGGGVGGGTGGVGPGPIDQSFLSPDGTYFVKEPPGDKPVGPDHPSADFCFNIVAHGAQQNPSIDKTKYPIPAGTEHYQNFQFKVPYTKKAWALSTRPIIDNNKVIHHWLLFQMGSPGVDGGHALGIGLQLGNALLTGWAPGGNPLDMPQGVGLEMPAPGGFLNMENHYNNATAQAHQDRSGVRMCVTYTEPQRAASLTWLGTETISIPANGAAKATGTCSTWKGRANTEVHIFQTVPHMHELGVHMLSVINRAGGQKGVIVDKPFSFADQRAYEVSDPAVPGSKEIIVKPNETLTTTCSFQNKPGSRAVGFGTQTSAEMCYNFVVYWPAHALDGRGGIEGSNNMCLQ